jgi:hypothetical protein
MAGDRRGGVVELARGIEAEARVVEKGEGRNLVREGEVSWRDWRGVPRGETQAWEVSEAAMCVGCGLGRKVVRFGGGAGQE